MSQADLAFDREVEQDIYYKELQEPIGKRRADFMVEGKVLVELKAVIELEDVHLAQILNYLKAYKPEVGLLYHLELQNSPKLSGIMPMIQSFRTMKLD